MKIVALLSWFNESPTWLAATISSAARFCDHVIALDGAYANFPGARASSGEFEHEAILRTAEAVGIGVTLHVPDEPYRGNEVEKRNLHFELAKPITSPTDWLFILDADETVVRSPDRAIIRGELEETDLYVANVTLSERTDTYDWQPLEAGWPEDKILPSSNHEGISGSKAARFFVADRSLRVEGTHYGVFVDDPELGPLPLRPHPWMKMPPQHDLTSVVLEHRTAFRVPDRRARSKTYYQIRKELNLETSI